MSDFMTDWQEGRFMTETGTKKDQEIIPGLYQH